MKKLLFSVIAMMVAVTSFAQNALVASLSHGETVTYYYGANAFSQAVEAAASGDIINLSGGVFNAVNITKGITIRGAGIDSATPTDINGDIQIIIPDNDDQTFTAEGIRFLNGTYMQRKASAPYCYFVRCQFKGLFRTYPDAATINNLAFLNCKFTDSFTAYGTSSVYLQNSYINQMQTTNSSSITATNCIINGVENSYTGITVVWNSVFTNCIFYNCSRSLPSTNQASNCINVGSAGNFDLFQSLSQRTGCPTDTKTYADVFKTFTGTYSDTETFELTDAAKTAYKDADERQIGLYGGSQPYTSVPSYPLITTMTVGEQTDANGQLSVTIVTNK